MMITESEMCILFIGHLRTGNELSIFFATSKANYIFRLLVVGGVI